MKFETDWGLTNRRDEGDISGISFYNVEMNMNFTLSHKDLFYEHENKIYFLIVFPIYGTDIEYWLLGKPFIKKYNLFLDKDKKIIGLYLNYTESKEKEETERQKEIVQKEHPIKYIVIIIILSLVLIIAIASLLYYFLVYKKSRRIRANELDDETDYIAQEDKKEGKDIIN